MATDFVLMNRRTFGIRTAALCFAAGMMVSPFSLAAEEPLLKIGVLPAADSVLLYAAESEGFFESRGLRIQLLPFKSAIEIGAAMRAGELAGHYGDLINVFTQNAAAGCSGDGDVCQSGRAQFCAGHSSGFELHHLKTLRCIRVRIRP